MKDFDGKVYTQREKNIIAKYATLTKEKER